MYMLGDAHEKGSCVNCTELVADSEKGHSACSSRDKMSFFVIVQVKYKWYPMREKCKQGIWICSQLSEEKVDSVVTGKESSLE